VFCAFIKNTKIIFFTFKIACVKLLANSKYNNYEDLFSWKVKKPKSRKKLYRGETSGRTQRLLSKDDWNLLKY